MCKQLLIIISFYLTCFAQAVKVPQIEFAPKEYICYRTNQHITIDGKLDEDDWNKAEWTENFVDIRGEAKLLPRFCTKVKMLWDKKYFYVAAKLEEPDVWATITTKDDTIFNDNCFELFIDPDGDTYNYCELEINALNTIWDLLLLKPYRDMKNPGITNWYIDGLKKGISICGTLNEPGDKDSCWIVELALPWETFNELSSVNIPPKDNDQWRINFLRVEWMSEVINRNYIKKVNPLAQKPIVNFWSWSPQGIVNMHYPEMWGFVQFSNELVGKENISFIKRKEEQAKWFLRQIYYAERNYFEKEKKYCKDLSVLGIKYSPFDGYSANPIIEFTPTTFQAYIVSDDQIKKVIIQNDGQIIIDYINLNY